MKISTASKNCEIYEASVKIIDLKTKKIEKMLKKMDPDSIKLDLILKYEKFFVCLINVSLPSGNIEVHSQDFAQDRSIRLSFDKLTDEIEKYKETHFPSHSKYPKRETI